MKGPIADKGELLGLRATGVAVAAGTTVGNVVRRVREAVQGAAEQVRLGQSTELPASAAEPSSPPSAAPVKKTAAKKTPAKRAAKKTAAKKVPAKKVGKKAAAKKKTPAKKSGRTT